MKTFLIILMAAMSCKVYANEADFKSSVLNGYSKRCVEVLTSKGFKSNAVAQECKCEVDVIDKNFNTFQLMIVGAKKATGQKLLSDTELKKIMSKIAECKERFLTK